MIMICQINNFKYSDSNPVRLSVHHDSSRTIHATSPEDTTYTARWGNMRDKVLSRFIQLDNLYKTLSVLQYVYHNRLSR